MRLIGLYCKPSGKNVTCCYGIGIVKRFGTLDAFWSVSLTTTFCALPQQEITKERDSLRLYPQNEGFCGARLTSPLDLLTSFSYFGARYYDPDLSGLFLSVDPMSDKYPFISPYAYCAWNPVKLVDPDGREVYINGSQSDKAVERLQTKKMIVKRDTETGKLSASFREGFSLSDLSNDEKIIYEAIGSEDISIQITAEKSILYEGVNTYISRDDKRYQTFGGSFDGSEYVENNGQKRAITYCFLDVDLLDKNGFNQGVPHEISEQYLMGQKTLELGKSINRATMNQYNPEYDECHKKAVFQESVGFHFKNFHYPPSIFGYKCK